MHNHQPTRDNDPCAEALREADDAKLEYDKLTQQIDNIALDVLEDAKCCSERTTQCAISSYWKAGKLNEFTFVRLRRMKGLDQDHLVLALDDNDSPVPVKQDNPIRDVKLVYPPMRRTLFPLSHNPKRWRYTNTGDTSHFQRINKKR